MSQSAANGTTLPDNGNVDIGSGSNDIAAIVVGMRKMATGLGTATGEKFGAMGATPIIQTTGTVQASITLTAGSYGFGSAAEAASIGTLLNEIRRVQIAYGFMKGSA